MTLCQRPPSGKLCFAYCGDLWCTCSLSPDYRDAQAALDEYGRVGGVSLEQLKRELEENATPKDHTT